MNNIALGQYVDKNSLIHKLDPRTKLFSLLLLMVTIFLVPGPSKQDITTPFIVLGLFTLFIIIVVLFTKISLFKYLGSLKQIAFLFIFTFIIQIFTPSGDTIINEKLYISVIGISFVCLWIIMLIVFRKFIKIKLLLFIILSVVSIYIFRFDFGYYFTEVDFKIYEDGLFNGMFFFLRVFLVIMLSTILTLTTKPTDLTSAIEWYLHPLTYLKVNVSVFAMIISIALRFISTLFSDTQKILKAQSSRGVDFKEGSLKSQIIQVISLLVPMLVIAFNRAYDLADAMEARGYIPGAKRTKINVMKFKIKDYFSIFISILIFVIILLGKVL